LSILFKWNFQSLEGTSIYLPLNHYEAIYIGIEPTLTI
jgi:hypothetical protein